MKGITTIPYGRQNISEDDIAAVVDVLRSDWLTQGSVVPEFEAAVAAHCEASHAVAVNSATSALHIACLALGLSAGDWLWTSPLTFVASANCALYCGAQVDFVDIDPATGNLSAQQLAEKLALAKQSGKLPKVVVPVHLCGEPCDMQAIHTLSKEYGFRIIEDASHAIGARYLDEPIGNCCYSDITVFSFHPVKIITTGEGGMAVTQDPELARRMVLLRSHGITRDPTCMTRPTDGDWYYQQIALGYNYRMTELQAALGLSQMTRLQAFIERRHALAQRYDQLLQGLALTLPFRNPASHSALHLYPVQVAPARRRQIVDALRDAGILVNVHYIPVHSQPYYERIGFRSGDFPHAERYYAGTISLPLYPMLDEAVQDRVVTQLTEAIAL